jgi:hypothetical protein
MIDRNIKRSLARKTYATPEPSREVEHFKNKNGEDRKPDRPAGSIRSGSS